ncbi:MAG: hypothetical protein EOS41_27300 [Mesorhizobium sp.]|uniref:bifunctional DNA primase/polymerase n=1 Tax=Mesorhizobium sp. TaxID=1871066 RepID=UPI000FEA9B62|nr:MAG: hypothetical protein EOS41_27300 [Mesorhizobium sp.]
MSDKFALPAQAAKAYVQRGWEPIPLRNQSKQPAGPWKDPRSWDDASIVAAFSGGSNIGIALGERSGDLVDIDFDWSEAAALAQYLLPEFPSFGRRGAPGSHRLAISAMPTGRSVFQLPTPLPSTLGRERTMVLELRGTGHQTMFPPSVHPSREVVQWSQEPDLVPEIESRELERRCGLLAGLAVVLRAYPREKGDRDNICLALTGSLIRAGLPDEEIDRLVHLVAREAGDEEAGKRGGKASATRRRIDGGETAWGLPELCSRLGIDSVEGVLRKTKRSCGGLFQSFGRPRMHKANPASRFETQLPAPHLH